MSSVDDNLKHDAEGDSTSAAALRRRRSRLVAACALAFSAGLVSLGISTGQTALSSAGLPAADIRIGTASSAASSLATSVATSVATPVAAADSRARSQARRSTSSPWLAGFGLRSTDLDRDLLRADLLGTRHFNGRPLRAAYTLRMRVTAYSPDERSCGDSADGITASGYSVVTNGGFLVAADPRVLPLGSLVSVPGYDDGAAVPVLDVGGAIKGNRLDVLFPTHEVAMRWGVRELDVTVWEYADGLPNGFKRQRRPSK
jgi:3D (Asp-Asp-Asp) domain-containing protein